MYEHVLKILVLERSQIWGIGRLVDLVVSSLRDRMHGETRWTIMLCLLNATLLFYYIFALAGSILHFTSKIHYARTIWGPEATLVPLGSGWRYEVGLWWRWSPHKEARHPLTCAMCNLGPQLWAGLCFRSRFDCPKGLFPNPITPLT